MAPVVEIIIHATRNFSETRKYKLAGVVLIPLGSRKKPTNEISAGDTVALVGTISAASAWGAPNFGETPEEDKNESYFILSTNRPIRMKDTDGSALPDAVKVQLILPGATDALHSKVKKYTEVTRVRVTGKAYPATTGHHHESIVLDVERVEKCLDLDGR